MKLKKTFLNLIGFIIGIFCGAVFIASLVIALSFTEIGFMMVFGDFILFVFLFAGIPIDESSERGKKIVQMLGGEKRFGWNRKVGMVGFAVGVFVAIYLLMLFLSIMTAKPTISASPSNLAF